MAKLTFNNFEDIYKDIKKQVAKDPGKYIEKGKKVKAKCPKCNKVTMCTFIDKNKVRCDECRTDLDVTFNVK